MAQSSSDYLIIATQSERQFVELLLDQLRARGSGVAALLWDPTEPIEVDTALARHLRNCAAIVAIVGDALLTPQHISALWLDASAEDLLGGRPLILCTTGVIWSFPVTHPSMFVSLGSGSPAVVCHAVLDYLKMPQHAPMLSRQGHDLLVGLTVDTTPRLRQRTREDRAARLQELAAEYYKHGLHPRALLCMEAALTLQRFFQTDRDLRIAESHRLLADYAFAAGNLPLAETHYLTGMKPLIFEFSNSSQRLLPYLQPLANLYEAQGDYSGALAIVRQALECAKQRFPPSRLIRCELRAQLGRLLEATGDPDAACQHYHWALKRWPRFQRTRNPHFAHLCNNLAVIEQQRGNFQRAADLLDDALATWERTAGKHSLDWATTAINRGVLLGMMGDPEAALHLVEAGSEIRQVELGVDHPLTQSSILWVARLIRDAGHPRMAIDAYRELREYMTANLPEDDPAIVPVLYELAALEFADGRWKPALQHLLETLPEARRDPHLRRHIFPAILDLLARTQTNRRKHEEAIRYRREQIELLREVVGHTHLALAREWERIGDLELMRGDPALAKEAFGEGLLLYERTRSGEHPGLWSIRRKLATLALQSGDTPGAVDQFSAILQREMRLWGLNDPRLVPSLYELGRATLQTGDSSEGLALLSRGLQLVRNNPEAGPGEAVPFLLELAQAELERRHFVRARLHLEAAIPLLDTTDDPATHRETTEALMAALSHNEQGERAR